MDTMRHKVVQIIAHRNAVALAQERLEQKLRDLFPVGSDIAWEIRHNLLGRGKVVDHGYGDVVMAINAKTGTRVAVSSYQIVRGGGL